MGVWGADILENDMSLDVHTIYHNKLEEGLNPEEAKSALHAIYGISGKPYIEDNTDYWFGLAQAQLDEGTLDEEVVGVIEKIIQEKIDWQDWIERAEEDDELIQERWECITQFWQDIQAKWNTK